MRIEELLETNMRNQKLRTLDGTDFTFDYSQHTDQYQGTFYFKYKGLTSFEGAPPDVEEDFDVSHNNLADLKNIHEHVKHIGGELNVENNPIKSHILGVLLIDGLQGVKYGRVTGKVPIPFEEAFRIVNKYLPNTMGRSAVLHCQNELIENGLDEYAKL